MAIVTASSITTPEMIVSSTYKFKAWSGYTVGTSTFTLGPIQCGSQATLEVCAAWTHYGSAFSSYGAVKIGVINVLNTWMTTVWASDVSSAGGGDWTFSVATNHQLSINKTAGTYAGGGYYIVSLGGYFS
jgi:hypothetical protein